MINKKLEDSPIFPVILFPGDKNILEAPGSCVGPDFLREQLTFFRCGGIDQFHQVLIFLKE